MILISKKMTSQKKFGEIELVPYNKPLLKENPFFLPAGKSAQILFVCDLFWREPRANPRAKKKDATG
jgi:hypothetical protein